MRLLAAITAGLNWDPLLHESNGSLFVSLRRLRSTRLRWGLHTSDIELATVLRTMAQSSWISHEDMGKRLSLRRATPHDEDIVISLIDAVAGWLKTKGTDQWSQPWPNRAERDRRIRSDLWEGNTWILWDGADPAATLTISADAENGVWTEAERRDLAVYVQRLALDRRYAGRGLGAQLVDWAGRRARQRYRAVWIRVDVWTTNYALQDYYRAMGFSFVRFSSDPEYPAGALLQKPTAGIAVPVPPQFEEYEELPECGCL
jgi:ribosomal protein S18 acetylase RimI-like enzyme